MYCVCILDVLDFRLFMVIAGILTGLHWRMYWNHQCQLIQHHDKNIRKKFLLQCQYILSPEKTCIIQIQNLNTSSSMRRTNLRYQKICWISSISCRGQLRISVLSRRILVGHERVESDLLHAAVARLIIYVSLCDVICSASGSWAANVRRPGSTASAGPAGAGRPTQISSSCYGKWIWLEKRNPTFSRSIYN